jgi:hypothetical protein
MYVRDKCLPPSGAGCDSQLKPRGLVFFLEDGSRARLPDVQLNCDRFFSTFNFLSLSIVESFRRLFCSDFWFFFFLNKRKKELIILALD